MGLTFKVRNAATPLSREVRQRASALVRKTTFNVEAGAKIRSRVDTGAMRNAWTSTMTDDLHGVISNSVEYAPVHEYGGRYITAQPMLAPSLDEQRSSFEAGQRELFK